MRERLRAPVGPGMPNHAADVLLLQRLLNGSAAWSAARLSASGVFDRATATAIVTFQRRVLRSASSLGVVRPDDETFWRLLEVRPRRLLAGPLGGLLLTRFRGPCQLGDDDFAQAASKLQCEVRAIKAVTGVESPNGPFDTMGRPPILFERHYFSRLTLRRYDGRYPQISNTVPGGYSFPEPDQYVRLQHAFALDAAAALRSASWGAFQIMGDNHAAAGFPTVHQFVRAMCQSVRAQLDAFAAFLQHDAALLSAIRQKDWVAFARRYNGSSYGKNHYDTNLAMAYESATA